MAASARHECALEGPSYTTRPDTTSTRSRGRSAKALRHTEICLLRLISASCLISSVFERASGGTWVAWVRFSVSHQVGTSGVHQIDTGSTLITIWDLISLTKCLRVHWWLPDGWPQTLVLGWGLWESSGWGQQSLSGPKRPRIGCVKGGVCSSTCAREKRPVS